MTSRRDFLATVAAVAGTRNAIPDAIARALAIDPATGSTFLDAEHIVVLMQENRSFDHCYGSLAGVRGFRDPQVHRQPNGRPVWFQTDAHGVTYPPFRLDITGSNATWIGGLPHSWADQVDAANNGRHDNWLIAKPKRDLPFTLGHYTRDDIPFYYALADAFTVCDQAFCSSLTGTTPNRLFLWTGNIRRDANDAPRVLNEETDYPAEADWTTFPERLQDAGVSWRIYQNEIGIDSGLSDDEDAWLGNFDDSPLEWFTQYNVRLARTHREWLPKLIAQWPERIAAAEHDAEATGLTAAEAKKRRATVASLRGQLASAEAEVVRWTDATWQALSPRQQALHERAFSTNEGDPAYRTLRTLRYQDGGVAREVQVPAGDLFQRFRADVSGGTLPAISWLVAPENLSDHPSAPWYGAWYVSETLDILTRNPEVWKKTILILCYDENDGYFDHVPPFTAPHPTRTETGAASAGIDTSIDWGNVHGRDHSIGLGFRVPLVVASPWSRGGAVNSQIFDHTSVLQLMEEWLAARGKPVREQNISAWRRTVCGDLSSAFRPYDGEVVRLPASIGRDATVERIYSAKFQQRPGAPAPVSADADTSVVRAMQERGTRPSCPLPYELHANARVEAGAFRVSMEARNRAFGRRSQGSPFAVYRYGAEMTRRAYAVRAGDLLHDSWPAPAGYQVVVNGPNGFVRAFSDGVTQTPLDVTVDFVSGAQASGMVAVTLANRGTSALRVAIADEGYGAAARNVDVPARSQRVVRLPTAASHGWYDVAVRANELVYRYAGRIETGRWGVTDPAMG
ncbi:MAG TPA: phospholipase C, phosphocholine-specific [Gemmatimonadales bacterium]|jgi:phospholipase C